MCEAQDVQQTNHEVGLTGTVGVWCRAVLGVVRRWPACLGWALLASLAAGCQCCYRAAFGGAGWLAAALSSCIMHDHVNGGGVVGLLAPPTWPYPPFPPQTDKVIPHGTIGRETSTGSRKGETREKKKKEGAGGNSV